MSAGNTWWSCKSAISRTWRSTTCLPNGGTRRYLEHLSLPITTEINILNPAVIILGGGVLSMPGFPREKLEQYIYKHSRKPFPADNLHIVYSDNGGENGIYGSALYARARLGRA